MIAATAIAITSSKQLKLIITQHETEGNKVSETSGHLGFTNIINDDEYYMCYDRLLKSDHISK